MLITTLYNEYIGRPKLTERENPVEHTIPPPLKEVRTKE